MTNVHEGRVCVCVGGCYPVMSSPPDVTAAAAAAALLPAVFVPLEPTDLLQDGQASGGGAALDLGEGDLQPGERVLPLLLLLPLQS